MRDLRVLLADDDPILRDGLAEVLDAQPGIEIVAVVADGGAALDAMTRYSVDVALLDVDMPGIDGIHAAARITAGYPSTTVVMLTAFENDSFLARALHVGAQGFLTKDIPVGQLAQLIQRAHAGETVMGAEPIRILTASYLQDQRRKYDYADFIHAVEKLPPHLRAVFGLLAQAVPNKTIARQLHLAEGTVRIYVSQILTATGCTNRSEIALNAMKSGLTS